MEAFSDLLIMGLGTITSLVMVALGYLNAKLATLPPFVRTMIVTAIAVPVALLSGYIGIAVPADPTTWDGATVNVILTALSAMGIHAGAKAATKTFYK